MSTNLFRFLEETPTHSRTALWVAHWGSGDSGGPRIVESITRAICTGNTGTSILLHGTYGSGKSTLMNLVLAQLRDQEPVPLICFIHLPALTSRLSTSTLGAVVVRAVEFLIEHGIPNDDADQESLRRCAETLWNHEANGSQDQAEDPLPHLSLLEEPKEAVQANQIELELNECLEQAGRRLVVVLDDLDRCPRETAVDIVRLLLRFQGQQRISFILASDSALLQSGVRKWMESYGTDQGRPLVTANSALEKYIHTKVRLPDLSTPAHHAAQAGLGKIADSVLTFLGSGQPEPVPETRQLVDVFIHEMLLSIEEQEGLELGGGRTVTSDRSVELPTLSDSPREEQVPPGDEPSTDVDPSARLQELEVEGLEAEGSGFGEQSGTGPSPDGGKKLKESHRIEKEIDTGLKASSSRHDKEFEHPLVYALRSLVFVAGQGSGSGAGAGGGVPPSAGTDVLRSLASVEGQGMGTPFLRARWRRLCQHLTLRQFKYLLRGYFLGAVGGRVANSPESVLLQQVFPPLERLKRSFPDLYRHLLTTASRVVASASQQMSPAPLEGGQGRSLDALDLSMFEQELRRVFTAIDLGEDALHASWPTRDEEKKLLVELLALTRAQPATSDLRPPPTNVGSEPGGGDQEPPEDFREWLRNKTGEEPTGFSIDDQLRSFQETVLRRFGASGQRSHSLVEEYYRKFFATHRNQLSRNSGSTLSNLAVIVSDATGLEAMTYDLFEEAMERATGEPRIPLFYADWLVGVLREEHPAQQLIAAERFPDISAILARCRELTHTETSDREYTHRFALVRFSLDMMQQENPSLEDSSTFRSVLALVDSSAPVIVEATRRHRMEPVTALNSMLSSVFGQGDGSLQRRCQVLSRAWAILRHRQAPTYIAVMYIGNNYVGQSPDRSPREELGMRLNHGLLLDPEFLRNGGTRVGQVLSQSATVVGRLGTAMADRESALALAFIAGLPYYTQFAEEWLQRVRFTLPKTLNLDPQAVGNYLQNVLSESDQQLFLQLRTSSSVTEPMAAITKRLFEPKYEPVRTVEEFAQEDGWDEQTAQQVLSPNVLPETSHE